MNNQLKNAKRNTPWISVEIIKHTRILYLGTSCQNALFLCTFDRSLFREEINPAADDICLSPVCSSLEHKVWQGRKAPIELLIHKAISEIIAGLHGNCSFQISQIQEYSIIRAQLNTASSTASSTAAGGSAFMWQRHSWHPSIPWQAGAEEICCLGLQPPAPRASQPNTLFNTGYHTSDVCKVLPTLIFWLVSMQNPRGESRLDHTSPTDSLFCKQRSHF